MSLKPKITIILLSVMVLLTGLEYCIQHMFVRPAFTNLQTEQAYLNLSRGVEALRREEAYLNKICLDWAAWDDTYEFVAEPTDDYVETNLLDETFVDAGLNLIFYYNLSGEVVWGKAVAVEDDEVVPINLDHFPLDSPPTIDRLLVHANAKSSHKGIIICGERPLIVASRPILTSDRGGPIRGTLVLGYYLSKEMIDELSTQTHVALQLMLADADDAEATTRRLLDQNGNLEPIIVEQTGKDNLQASTIINDINGEPALLVQANTLPEISNRGNDALHFAQLSVLAGNLLVLVVILLFLQRHVLTPISRLSNYAGKAGKTASPPDPLDLNHRDELGRLAATFNQTVQDLYSARMKLLEQSYLAGRAEVAASVLHNIGNVLNSLNVSVGRMSSMIRESNVADVQKTAQVLQDNANDLPAFFSAGARGEHMPSFLDALSSRLATDNIEMAEEADSLAVGIGHIKDIIHRQKDNAEASDLYIPIKIPDLVNDALKICKAELVTNKVDVAFDVPDLPNVLIDRQKAVQILVNLISNAAKALAESDQTLRTVSISINVHEKRVRIEIADNGKGIEPDNLIKIFRHGFSSRKDGQGLGLHSSALMAREMKGSLKASSDGPGHGACFVLELPYTVESENDEQAEHETEPARTGC